MSVYIYIYIYILYIYIYMHICILPVNAIIRVPYPRRGDSQVQETLSVLAPSADNQTRNYDTEC